MKRQTVRQCLFMAVICTTLSFLAAPSAHAEAEPDEKDFTPEFVAQCKARAEAGDTEGMALYGRALSNGWGIEKDQPQSYNWLKKAADAGDLIGMTSLSQSLRFGYGVEKDIPKANALLMEAVEQGFPRAQWLLGLFYHDGTGMEKDAEKAVEWYHKAAEQGYAAAQFALGMCHINGDGVGKDMAKAVDWFRRAAEQGLPQAQRNLGLCYLNGYGVEKDFANAVDWFRKAAEQGDALAQFYLATTGWTEQDTQDYWERWAEAATRLETSPRIKGGTDNADEAAGERMLEEYAQLKELQKRAKVQGTRDSMSEAVAEAVATRLERLETSLRKRKDAGNADEATGEGMIEAFGTAYMPNAFAVYQEAREKAKERAQILKENFPQGRNSDSTDEGLYDKISKATAKAIFEMDRRHDELCHFYLLHKAGVMTDAELAEKDQTKILIMLPKPLEPNKTFCLDDIQVKRPSEAERTFANKYLPEVIAAYDRFEALLADGRKSFEELRADAVRMDAVRESLTLEIFRYRLARIGAAMDMVADLVKRNKLLYDVEEISADGLAKLNHGKALELRELERILAVRDFTLAKVEQVCTEVFWERELPTIPQILNMMVQIPGQNYMIGRYEVTQAQWEAVMKASVPGQTTFTLDGKEITQSELMERAERAWSYPYESRIMSNPSPVEGANLPVNDVSGEAIHFFLQKLNSLDFVKASGLEFRLPTAEEWEYACGAGARGDYCRLADGTEITSETLHAVAWYGANANGQTHPVGQKKPNAFGLYDMLGNVCEWTDGGGRGGASEFPAEYCKAEYECWNYHGDTRRSGFRLCATKRR